MVLLVGWFVGKRVADWLAGGGASEVSCGESSQSLSTLLVVCHHSEDIDGVVI